MERTRGSKGVYNWEKIEESNQIERWKKEGKYIVLRFVLDYPSDTPHEDIPSWLIKEMSDPGDRYASEYGKGFSPNYSDKNLISYYQKAVAAMGERWAKSGQIAFIQLGVLGHWGEWHIMRKRISGNYQKQKLERSLLLHGFKLFQKPIF